MNTVQQPHCFATGVAGGIACAALALAGCSGVDDSVVELGRIEFFHDPAIIEAPSSVALNEQFLVRVISYGGGCIAFERTDVKLSNDGAEVLPFDRRHIPTENEACTSDLRLYPHEVMVSFGTVGTKTLRIHGRHVSFGVDEPIEIPLMLVVE